VEIGLGCGIPQLIGQRSSKVKEMQAQILATDALQLNYYALVVRGQKKDGQASVVLGDWQKSESLVMLVFPFWLRSPF